MKQDEIRKIAQEITQADLTAPDLHDRIVRVLTEATTVKAARETIAEAFKDDPAFRHSYVANASVNIQAAARRRLAQPECDALASQIVKLFFEEPA